MSKKSSSNHKLQIEYLPIEKPVIDERNPRTHSDRQIVQIAASITQFKFNAPILVDAENRIIAGHGRLAAAKYLNWKIVPVVRLEHMDEVQRRAYAIADNRLAELAGWDKGLLRIEMQALEALDRAFDLEITGFDTRRCLHST